MKKMLKSFVAAVLSLTLVVSGLGITKNVSAVTQEDEWKANAVKTPAEGKLIGAGYIDVEFDNSMEGYTYSVYLDGQPVYWDGNSIVRSELGEKVSATSKTKTFTSGDEGKTEVYTNTVSKHEITVKAQKDGQTITSEPRTFYVSKKGMAMGGDMSDKVAMRKLNVSWYYNWAVNPFNNSVDENVDHVPMMWGGGNDNTEAMKTFTTNSNYILGFNEPDIVSQANMNYWDAVKVWGQYIKPLKLRKISPAPAAPGGDSNWLKKFMFGGYICKNTWLNDGSWGDYNDYEDEATKTWVAGYNDDVDAVVLHYYRNIINLDGMIEAVQRLWNTYHKPIWITEVSVVGTKGTDQDYSYELPEAREKMAKYVQGMVEKMDAIPYVERYCWFSYNVQSYNEIDSVTGAGATAMFDYDTGKFTELGKLYSNIGNPDGYNAYSISEDETYVYVEPETTIQQTTALETTLPITSKNEITEESKQKEPFTTKSKKKPPEKVQITKAKNIKKKTVSLKWKKIKKAQKYEIQYSVNRKFKKAKKTYVKSTLKKITKLKKNKKYYFRIRAISNVGRGNWSNVRMVKIRM